METSYQATYEATQTHKETVTLSWTSYTYVRTWIPMALPTLTNHGSTTVLGKRHSREITYQVPSHPYAARLISVGRRVGGAWVRG